MGKKSKEGEKESSDAFKTLFGDSNPYRRKPQSDQDQQPKQKEPHQDPSGLGLGFGTSGGEGEEDNPAADSPRKEIEIAETKKKRKRERERNPFLEADVRDSAIRQKRKKRTEDDDQSTELIDGKGNEARKKKRKRDEIEEEYEMKMYGGPEKIEGGDAEPGRIVVGEKRKAGFDTKEMVVSKEAYDDESKLQRTVFVGNLPLKVKKKVLLRDFGQFGEVESVRIRSVPIVDSKIPRKGAIIKGKFNDSADSVHAYIVFKDEQSAQAALSHNMAKLGENHIRVDRACPPRKKLKGENALLYDNKRTLFVGNLPFDVKDEELYQLFCGVNHMESSIEAIRVIRDPHSSVGKGIAYVMFKTREAANTIVKKKNFKLRDRDLRLYHAKSDSTPSKRKKPEPAWAENSPGKRLAVDSRQKPSNTTKSMKVTKAADLSYQGLRASKSGVQKKGNLHLRTEEHGKIESKGGRRLEPKARKTKRPAVEARKAKALKAGGGAVRQLGQKRKLESRTPENSHRDKIARKFR
ncbi:nucleolar protein 12 [Magnolia sinica]|uniref:nucleolar protein 12 n=1 Tax=Magnolia sinica TaxID=86752 RepID=UPI00265A88FC|nr:nucleolar protein 12 [Magnolia sinica]